MKITVEQSAMDQANELTKLAVRCEGIERLFALDIDFSAVLNVSWNVHVPALDFLIICASVYAIDKIVPRSSTGDLWMRKLEVTIPVREIDRWKKVAEELSECVSFLTGDEWEFSFSQAERDFKQRRQNRRKKAKGFPKSPIVSLLSGGLDSFIGALDLLHEHKDAKLLFVSHYDGHVSGPASDQEKLRQLLSARFLNRVSHLQVRTGVRIDDEEEEKYQFETSFRSRSLMFLGLATYAALKIGPETPIIIPENGPISLNMPLNPSRRGACSTRTVHPFFIELVSEVLRLAGIENPIINPYILKTKGEMTRECKIQDVLKEGHGFTNSCGKAGRKTHWKNRKARACGACVPCLLRRAALHSADLDTEDYGNDALKYSPADFPDFHALLGLVRRNPSEQAIKKSLLANGRLKVTKLSRYADVVRRMIDEVSKWISDKGSQKACALAGLKSAQK
jgi:7-cyano-7-deazaguanine synthase in queuosine biosynthesis